MKSKFKLLLTIVSVMLLLLMTACGGNASKGPNSGQGGQNQNASGNSGNNAAGNVDFPKKPVTLIVPFAAGGGTDATARALTKATEKHLGQPIVVENKAGGTGSVGMTEGANAKPDGYTVTMITVELVMIPHLGLSPLTYEAFKPVAQINYDSAAVTVRADAPWNTIQEFLDYAKNNPGKVKVGNAGPGSIWHLATAALEKGTGVKFNPVPFDGAAPAVTALLGGHVDAVAVSPAEVKAQVEAGKLKTLAVFSKERSDALPDVPTLQEEGITGVESIGTWRGLAVPKDTPDEIVKILQDAFLKGANEPEFQEYMKKSGLGIVLRGSEDFTTFIKVNHDTFGKLISEMGLNNNKK